jgi:hypothetical protein
LKLERNRLHGFREGRHVVGVAGEQKITLLVLGVADLDEDGLRTLLHLQSMQHHHVGLARADQSDDDGEHRREHEEEARRDDDPGVTQQSVGSRGAGGQGRGNPLKKCVKSGASGAGAPPLHLA